MQERSAALGLVLDGVANSAACHREHAANLAEDVVIAREFIDAIADVEFVRRQSVARHMIASADDERRRRSLNLGAVDHRAVGLVFIVR